MNVHSYTKTSAKKDDQHWAVETASVFKILADSTRCRILKLLAKNPNGMCVFEIADAVGISHSAASHQLNNLETRGVLVSFREGQTVCYELADTRLARNIIKVLKLFYV